MVSRPAHVHRARFANLSKGRHSTLLGRSTRTQRLFTLYNARRRVAVCARARFGGTADSGRTRRTVSCSNARRGDDAPRNPRATDITVHTAPPRPVRVLRLTPSSVHSNGPVHVATAQRKNRRASTNRSCPHAGLAAARSGRRTAPGIAAEGGPTPQAAAHGVRKRPRLFGWRCLAVAPISSRAPRSAAGNAAPACPARVAACAWSMACAAASARVHRGVDRRPPPFAL